jgi:hypothetical protein
MARERGFGTYRHCNGYYRVYEDYEEHHDRWNN